MTWDLVDSKALHGHGRQSYGHCWTLEICNFQHTWCPSERNFNIEFHLCWPVNRKTNLYRIDFVLIRCCMCMEDLTIHHCIGIGVTDNNNTQFSYFRTLIFSLDMPISSDTSQLTAYIPWNKMNNSKWIKYI